MREPAHAVLTRQARTPHQPEPVRLPNRGRIEENPATAPVRTWPQLLRGDDLTADDTRWAMSEVMDDAHEPVAFAGFLIALRAKGETAGEISGLLGALMDRAPPLPGPANGSGRQRPVNPGGPLILRGGR
ncbi:hypothetical protein [Streptomyces griseus]|uniref:hypothetical protein n=1 Tax=Streptomyces griseus TaxID=1911 RepID=UPI00367BB079